MRTNTTNILRATVHLAFVLGLAFQVNLGYAATSCAVPVPGQSSCHGSSEAAAALQSACCCPEITSCQRPAEPSGLDVAEEPSTTVQSAGHTVVARQLRSTQGPVAQVAARTPNPRPPLRLLKQSFLI